MPRWLGNMLGPARVFRPTIVVAQKHLLFLMPSLPMNTEARNLANLEEAASVDLSQTLVGGDIQRTLQRTFFPVFLSSFGPRRQCPPRAKNGVEGEHRFPHIGLWTRFEGSPRLTEPHRSSVPTMCWTNKEPY